MRLVLDTNVIVAAVRSPGGASAELLRRARAGEAVLLASVPLFIECEAVATRREHREAAGTSLDDVGIILDALASLAEQVDIACLWRPQLRVTDDDMALEAAVNGRARAIVTFNVTDFGSVPAWFGIDAAKPSEILKRL